MAWRHSGDKPLSEPMMVSLPTHICVTQPQWVKKIVSYCICSSVLRYSFVHSLFQLCLGNLCISKIQRYKNTALVSWKSDYRIRLEMKKDRQTIMKIVAQSDNATSYLYSFQYEWLHDLCVMEEIESLPSRSTFVLVHLSLLLAMDPLYTTVIW